MPKTILNGTLCWKCSRLDCSWMKSLVPVKGWTAEKTSIFINKGKTLPSCHVIKCPEFKE